MPQVSCSVANCEYWSSGNKCHADEIMIDIDAHAKSDYGSEFAGDDIGSAHHDSARSVSNTCCHTFKAKK